MQTYLNVSLINLWCTKNLVDSQYFLGRLFDMSLKTPEYQLNYFTDPFDQKTEIVFLNTCGFISSWRDEADAMVKKLLNAWKTVYLMWCAVQYYKKLKEQGAPLLRTGQARSKKQEPATWNLEPVSQVHYLSRGDLNTVTLKDILQWYDSTNYGDFQFSGSPRVYTNLEQKFEYLKIAEWCDNHCTFCIIPQIRGKLHSRTIPDIVKEAENMIQNGIKEIILIAQDTTRFGYDRFGKSALLTLLRRLDRIPGDFMYRLLYLYPDIVTLHQIKELKKLKKFIPYFDIPLQHISSSVLKKMGRFIDDEWYIKKFLDQIKTSFPIRFIRTNLIIGFPGETKQDFDTLVKFVDETKFDNIALFEYHDEPLAASSKLPHKVDNHEIRTRFTKIRQLVNRQLLEKEHARKWTQEIGYITEIWDKDPGTRKNKKSTSHASRPTSLQLVVRPRLHCPEIDSYDEISMEQVIGTYESKSELEIWDKIIYTV